MLDFQQLCSERAQGFRPLTRLKSTIITDVKVAGLPALGKRTVDQLAICGLIVTSGVEQIASPSDEILLRRDLSAIVGPMNTVPQLPRVCSTLWERVSSGVRTTWCWASAVVSSNETRPRNDNDFALSPQGERARSYESSCTKPLPLTSVCHINTVVVLPGAQPVRRATYRESSRSRRGATPSSSHRSK